MSSQQKCGYCGTRGHKINVCNHPFAINIWRTFQSKLNENYDPSQHNFADRAHYVYQHLSSLSLKELKVIASKINITLSSFTKPVLVFKIMESYFVNHPYPEWRVGLPIPAGNQRRRGVAPIWENSIEYTEIQNVREEVNSMERIEMEQLRSAIMTYQGFIMQNPIQEHELRWMNRAQLLRLIHIFHSEVANVAGLDNHNYGYANNPDIIDRKVPIVITHTPIPECADQYEVKECAICYENVTVHHMVQYNCKHEFCGGCVTEMIKTGARNQLPTCAMCRTEVSTFEIHAEYVLQKLEPLILG